MNDRLCIRLKRICRAAILCLTGSLIAAGCQKAPINGDLDGQWQVMEVEPKVEHPQFGGRLYYCFSLHVCQLTTGPVVTSGNLSYAGDRIDINFPRFTSQAASDSLRWWGINSNPVTFKVEHLDKNRLVIRDGETTVTLRKY